MTSDGFLDRWPAHVIRLDETGSTNTDAQSRLQAGHVPDFAIVASRQVAGRGRSGKQWESPAGNLYLSAVLTPDVPAARAGELAFVTANAVADAVVQITGYAGIKVKWPNDLLVEDRKIGGILVENHVEDGRIAHSIIGIGINVTNAPEAVTYLTDCVARHKPAATVEEMLDLTLSALRTEFRQWRDLGFSHTRDKWLARAWRINQPVSVTTSHETVNGIMAGIDERGALLIEHNKRNLIVTSGSLAYGPG